MPPGFVLTGFCVISRLHLPEHDAFRCTSRLDFRFILFNKQHFIFRLFLLQQVVFCRFLNKIPDCAVWRPMRLRFLWPKARVRKTVVWGVLRSNARRSSAFPVVMDLNRSHWDSCRVHPAGSPLCPVGTHWCLPRALSSRFSGFLASADRRSRPQSRSY